MIRLLVLGLVLTLWSLTIAAPVNNTAPPHKGIVFPKKGKTEEHKNPTAHTTVSSGGIKSTEHISESTVTTLTPTYIPVTAYEQSEIGIPTGQEEEPMVHMIPEESAPSQEESAPPPEEPDQYPEVPDQHPEGPDQYPEQSDNSPESDPTPEEDSPQEPEGSSEHVPGGPLPPDSNDGLIEYNLGNPLALKLHLPWWPLKDMLKSIQDAISVMNLTMSGDTVEVDNTKTKIVQFDDRNYTLKVRVFKPHENNRLLVRLISLTPVIEEGKLPVDKGMNAEEDDDKKNEALEDSAKKPLDIMKKKGEEKDGKEKRKDDSDDDDGGKKEENKKSKDSKKEKSSKKKKEEKKGSDSEKESD